MKPSDSTIISAAAGSVVLLLFSIAGFHLFGPEPLWLPMTRGGHYFNPSYLTWLLVSIPIGSLLGSVASIKQQAGHVSWQSCLIGWLVGCIIGCLAFYQSVIFLGVLHPLLFCSFGLGFTIFVFWAMHRKTFVNKEANAKSTALQP